MPGTARPPWRRDQLAQSKGDVDHTIGGEVPAMTAILTWGTGLTILDRCDRCGADAKVRIVFPSGTHLLFCGHHGRRYEKKLLEVAAVVEWNP
jgi:hypothetical protein